MGCKTLPYWTGTFCFDYILFLLIYFMYIIGGYACLFAAITKHLGFISLVFFFSGFSFISFNYLVSYIFTRGGSAFVHIVWINLLIAFLIPMTIYFIGYLSDVLFLQIICACISP